MNDQELFEIWTELEPKPDPRRRIDARVFEWLDAHDTTLVAEWLGLFKVSPFTAVGLATVSAVAVLATTPVIWLLGRLI
jgi:hypothetical protein